jgi:hypothetical protein
MRTVLGKPARHGVDEAASDVVVVCHQEEVVDVPEQPLQLAHSSTLILLFLSAASTRGSLSRATSRRSCRAGC